MLLLNLVQNGGLTSSLVEQWSSRLYMKGSCTPAISIAHSDWARFQGVHGKSRWEPLLEVWVNYLYKESLVRMRFMELCFYMSKTVAYPEDPAVQPPRLQRILQRCGLSPPGGVSNMTILAVESMIENIRTLLKLQTLQTTWFEVTSHLMSHSTNVFFPKKLCFLPQTWMVYR